MNEIRVTGKTVEDAVTEACIQLGTTSDNIEYEVIEKGSKGLLGFGAKLAVIDARRKAAPAPEPVAEQKSVREDKPVYEKRYGDRPNRNASYERKNDVSKAQSVKNDKEEAKAERKPVEKKNTSNAAGANKKPANNQSKADATERKPAEKKTPVKTAPAQTVKETVENDKIAVEAAPVKEEAPVKELKPFEGEKIQAAVDAFLRDVFKAMHMEVEMKYQLDAASRTISIELIGDDMGVLIGKRGQTLDSLQYLISLVANKDVGDYVRVKLDTENYRRRRRATLENLAKNIAYKVKRERKPVTLEPMNPYERRIIHSTLQNDRYVETHSEGVEPYRHVVVTLKKNGGDKADRV